MTEAERERERERETDRQTERNAATAAAKCARNVIADLRSQRAVQQDWNCQEVLQLLSRPFQFIFDTAPGEG